MKQMSKVALIVEDLVFYSERLGNILSKLGLEVLYADHGREALGILRQSKVDVIFLDNNMPIMTGLEFLDVLKTDSTKDSLPVIMMSTDNSINCLAVAQKGARDWVEKDAKLKNIRRVLARVGIDTEGHS